MGEVPSKNVVMRWRTSHLWLCGWQNEATGRLTIRRADVNLE